MKITPELDNAYFISTLLNIFFLLGLIFIMKLDNLFILIPYAIVMVLNAIYLVIKAAKIAYNKPNI
ncbi:hypothetical protein [Staphylococcus kloosii]|uniref:Uncharacterized protein n=1 Tax=Staphylococcus kloosii TaxID=29384 RepID=A0A151A753_9STAP|nr:hypothetical protein [Staphylococcus kloosii]KYH15055.1 hypothetical protein A0131_09760 [Staphylococcus kloosii]MCD8878102.1 hypothetical protein [Staphylococcus kloosii]